MPKKKKAKRVTAASVVVKEFSKKRVPSDDEIIKTVKKLVKDSNFDKGQLAWYKTRARTGKPPFDKKIDIPKAKRAATKVKAKASKKKTGATKKKKKKKSG